MIKTLITVVVIAAVAFGGWQIYVYWLKVQDEKAAAEKQASATVDPNSLPGLPYELQDSLNAAEQHGQSSLGSWLKMYGAKVQDPRKAWIELDYVVMITRDNPQEAKRVFAEVKDRTPPDSKVWPRIQGMDKTYE